MLTITIFDFDANIPGGGVGELRGQACTARSGRTGKSLRRAEGSKGKTEQCFQEAMAMPEGPGERGDASTAYTTFGSEPNRQDDFAASPKLAVPLFQKDF